MPRCVKYCRSYQPPHATIIPVISGNTEVRSNFPRINLPESVTLCVAKVQLVAASPEAPSNFLICDLARERDVLVPLVVASHKIPNNFLICNLAKHWTALGPPASQTTRDPLAEGNLHMARTLQWTIFEYDPTMINAPFGLETTAQGVGTRLDTAVP